MFNDFRELFSPGGTAHRWVLVGFAVGFLVGAALKAAHRAGAF